MKKISFVAALGFFLLTQGQALTPEEIAANVEKKLNSMRSLQAEFENLYYSMSVSLPLREKGIFYFKRPDRMRWEYKEPEKKLFLFKEGTFLFYIPEENQLIRSRTFKEGYESGILALLGGRQSLRDNYRIELNAFPTENKKVHQIKLTPRAEGEFSYILLEIDASNWLILKAIFFDWAGNKQEFRFSRIRIDVPLPSNLFDLEVPPGCEIIDDEDLIKK